MNTAILGLLAESPIHPGTGRGVGVVDLPVAREAVTHYPVLVGSSLKGALKDKAKRTGADGTERLFGKTDHAGDLLVSDARLLLLPVRSLTTSFRWATCPYLIERYRRDCLRAGVDHGPPTPLGSLGGNRALAVGDTELFLEERQFAVVGKPPDDLVEAIKPLVFHGDTQARLAAQIAILGDDDFTWFARYGLTIQARNVLEEDTKKSKNLWYEETLPPDTVMYALIVGRNDETLGVLEGLFPQQDPYMQAGGNETVGHGWFAVTVRKRSTESPA